MAYHLEGRLLEVCNCRVLCPCWIGEDPDRGTCDAIVAWHFDKGTIDGVDVAGTTLAVVAHIRHRHTRYDQLLMRGYDRNEARGSIRDEVDRVLESWRHPG